MEVYNIAAMAFEETVGGQKLGFQGIQGSGGADGTAVGQVQQQLLVLGFHIFNIPEQDPVNSMGAADGDGPGIVPELFLKLVQAPVKSGGVQGLQQIVVRLDGVGFHGKFRRGGEKDDLHGAVGGAELPGGFDAVEPRHHHIQKNNVEGTFGVGPEQRISVEKGFQVAQLGFVGPLEENGAGLGQNVYHIVANGDSDHNCTPFFF